MLRVGVGPRTQPTSAGRGGGSGTADEDGAVEVFGAVAAVDADVVAVAEAGADVVADAVAEVVADVVADVADVADVVDVVADVDVLDFDVPAGASGP